jgi:hypothetical protein
MNGAEAIGEAVSGGLVARAVEPAAGEQDGEAAGACLNCGTALVGSHCHRCGQPARVHRSVAAWWHDLAHGVLHLDGKIWRTLPLLAFHPGALTRRYIAGERAKFVSPLALFLFSVFLMFAVFSTLGVALVGLRGDAGKAVQVDAAKVDVAVATLEKQRSALQAKHQPTAAVESELRQARTARSVMTIAGGEATPREPALHTDLHTGWPGLDHGIEAANRNPALLFYKMQSNGYKFSWALVPISVPFLWLLFLHRRRYRQRYKAYDHLIFVTYSIAFMSLWAIMAVVLVRLGLTWGPVGLALLLIPPVHIYRQLRGAYALGRLSAAWRTAALLVFASLAMLLFLLLLLALGVMH